jgi:rSAM/selenodomain-associated transferase 2
MISIIVPALNEAAHITATLEPLQVAREAGHEVLVVDGRSTDGTEALAAPLADRVLSAPRGRARQMNAGAAAAGGDILWFLHADTRVPADVCVVIERAIAQGAGWGRFDVRLSGQRAALRMVEFLMNRRSRITGIATGDQGIFVRRALFTAIGGFPDIPLMEDIALSTALRQHGRPACLPGPLVTSSRRWETSGVWRTIWLMWRLRYAYWRGDDPAELHRRYYGGQRKPHGQARRQ